MYSHYLYIRDFSNFIFIFIFGTHVLFVRHYNNINVDYLKQKKKKKTYTTVLLDIFFGVTAMNE